MNPSEKTAWGVAAMGYAFAALRYIFGAGTLSQRLANVEGKLDTMARDHEIVARSVARIEGQLSRMNGGKGSH